MERYIKKIYQGIGVDTLIFILTVAINFSIIPIYLKFITMEELGIYFSIQGIIAVISLADIGLSMYSVKKLSHDSFFTSSELVPYLHSVQIFQYILGMALLFLGSMISPYIYRILNIDLKYSMIVQSLFFYSWISVIVTICFGINYAILQSRHKLILANTALFGIFFISCVLNIYFLYQGYGIDSLGISLLISTVVVSLFISHKVYMEYKILLMFPVTFKMRYIQDGWQYVRQFQLLRIAQIAKTSLFTVLLSYYGGQAIVAQYNISNKLPQLIPAFISKIIMNFFPSLSALFTSGKKEEIRSFYQKIFTLGIITTLFALYGIYSLNELFVDLWVGEGKFIDNNLFVYILLSFIVFSMISFTGIIIHSSGEFNKMPLLSFLEVVIFLVLSSILFHFYGLVGFFIGYVFSIAIGLIYSLKIISEMLSANILLWIWVSLKQAFPSFIILIALNLFFTYIVESLFIRFIMILAIDMIVYVLLIRKYK